MHSDFVGMYRSQEIKAKPTASSTSPKYQGTPVTKTKDDSKGKKPEQRVPAKKVSAPVKSPKPAPSNPFDEEDELYDSKNPFAEDYDSDSPKATDVTQTTQVEGSSTNPFDEPDDYDKEKNPFAT